MLRTNPSDYAHIIGHCSATGDLPLIIGGQGVNLWALYFIDEEEGLEDYIPFTSADCDVVADMDWLMSVAQKTGLAYKTYKPGCGSPEIGKIVVPLSTGETMVQVLRGVIGANIDQLSSTSLVVELGGHYYKVVHPAVLLQAKLANVLQLPQSNRQDIKHVKILRHCVHAFLREQIDSAMQESVSARECVAHIRLASRVITSPEAHRVASEHGISFLNILPGDLSPDVPEAIRNFFEKELPRLRIANGPDVLPIVRGQKSRI